MPDYKILPRTESGLDPIVYANDGVTRRPALTDEQWLVVHWPGVETDWSNWPFPGATTSDLVKRIDEIAAASGKRNEYNYVIGRQPADEFVIHEYAALFAAAHSAGENTEAFGVLFVTDGDEPLLQQQIDAFRWLRWELARTGSLSVDHVVEPHSDMPGANTGCPGPGVTAAMPALRVLWTPPPPPPPGEDMTDEQFDVFMTEQKRQTALMSSQLTQLRYMRGGTNPNGGTYGTHGVQQVRQDTARMVKLLAAISESTGDAGSAAALEALTALAADVDELSDHLGVPDEPAV